MPFKQTSFRIGPATVEMSERFEGDRRFVDVVISDPDGEQSRFSEEGAEQLTEDGMNRIVQRDRERRQNPPSSSNGSAEAGSGSSIASL
jgi:hypothetical protein